MAKYSLYIIGLSVLKKWRAWFKDSTDAKVAIAHGRMTSKDLENIILGFLNKEFNVLVCTTIIETGMDISMLILW